MIGGCRTQQTAKSLISRISVGSRECESTYRVSVYRLLEHVLHL
jgi:hypothetical protein